MRSPVPPFRRPRLLVAALTVAALSLTGCGGSDEPDAAPSSQAPTTRVVEATNGSITIPADPQKIVGINYATGALLDVGVVPVGTTKIEEPLELTPEQQAAGAGITEIGAGDQINLEKVASVQPDLIIVEGADFGWPIDKLSAIAPTLYFEVKAPSDLVASAEKIAEAVGKGDQLKGLKDAYDAKITEIKGKYPEQLKKKFTVVSTYGGGNYYLGTRTSWIGQVVDDLGGAFSQASSSTETHETEESLENLSKLNDADVILIGRSGGEFTPETTEMLNSSSFKLLPAAKSSQVHGIDFSYADRYTTMTAVLGQIEKILQGL
ncbi:ABC transporter substrate-binding protein [Actinocorallia sp. A-T 12471]|uniref:ABC transporter substrate-binding protein n=1 Tax=Actinocorallia sp. A-T 12471 TaxID=3089813 RepID=UPI0029CDB860|nr:ABC transporter substrate-binding protein [Actinocorallia sp. A-T 12471]MDX6740070.1 ABC transporter substrate-binding protein [Actinocorallia sp. A-T 12471]